MLLPLKARMKSNVPGMNEREIAAAVPSQLGARRLEFQNDGHKTFLFEPGAPRPGDIAHWG
jgi:hypothetical protein